MKYKIAWHDRGRGADIMRYAYCTTKEDARELAQRLRQYDDIGRVETTELQDGQAQ